MNQINVKPKGKPRGKEGGRNPIYSEPLFKATIRISNQHVLTLEEIDINLSAAIRAVLDDPKVSKAIHKFIDERKSKS